jgi:hypothetical protein
VAQCYGKVWFAVDSSKSNSERVLRIDLLIMDPNPHQSRLSNKKVVNGGKRLALASLPVEIEAGSIATVFMTVDSTR